MTWSVRQSWWKRCRQGNTYSGRASSWCRHTWHTSSACTRQGGQVRSGEERSGWSGQVKVTSLRSGRSLQVRVTGHRSDNRSQVRGGEVRVFRTVRARSSQDAGKAQNGLCRRRTQSHNPAYHQRKRVLLTTDRWRSLTGASALKRGQGRPVRPDRAGRSGREGPVSDHWLGQHSEQSSERKVRVDQGRKGQGTPQVR